MVKIQHMKLMTRLSLTAIVSLVAMMLMTFEAITSIKELLYEDRQAKTRHIVEVGHGVLSHFHSLQTKGTVSEADAKKGAIEAIKALRSPA